MYKKVLLIKKDIILFCSLPTIKKKLSVMGLFWYLSRISLGQYCLKIVVKSGGWEKDTKEATAI